ncbi:MAG: hypothetical protein EZS28_025811 [Streblomastix strix]|uniref:Uncharacterized protein n=1 Tax=Streblomastix strix TaxID=222440 RepID=A0A5J4V7Z2_9EUKA|nr:MAG: hypothetical protein EZS28_025811 [Streblomastix strix]
MRVYGYLCNASYFITRPIFGRFQVLSISLISLRKIWGPRRKTTSAETNENVGQGCLFIKVEEDNVFQELTLMLRVLILKQFVQALNHCVMLRKVHPLLMYKR